MVFNATFNVSFIGEANRLIILLKICEVEHFSTFLFIQREENVFCSQLLFMLYLFVGYNQ
jgi:hypothetical protein